MSKAYYDEFSRLTEAKMSQAMEDMTYAYNETRVPKSHYKKLLSKPIEELIESNVSINLIDVYYKTIKQLREENPKWFFEAIVCLEKGVKPSTIKPNEYQALELTWSKYVGDKQHNTFLSDDIVIDFEMLKKDGADYLLEKGQEN